MSSFSTMVYETDETSWTPESLASMKRADLQGMLKSLGLKGANKKSSEMASIILEHRRSCIPPSPLQPEQSNVAGTLYEQRAECNDPKPVMEQQRRETSTERDEDKENEVSVVERRTEMKRRKKPSKKDGKRRHGNLTTNTGSENANVNEAFDKEQISTTVDDDHANDVEGSQTHVKSLDESSHFDDAQEVPDVADMSDTTAESPWEVVSVPVTAAEESEPAAAKATYRQSKARSSRSVGTPAEGGLPETVNNSGFLPDMNSNEQGTMAMEGEETSNDRGTSQIASSTQSKADSRTPRVPEAVAPQRVPSISNFLAQNNLSQLTTLFRREELTDWTVVRALTVDTLRSLGVTAGTAIRFRLALQELFPSEDVDRHTPRHVNLAISMDSLQALMDEMAGLSLGEKRSSSEQVAATGPSTIRRNAPLSANAPHRQSLVSDETLRKRLLRQSVSKEGLNAHGGSYPRRSSVAPVTVATRKPKPIPAAACAAGPVDPVNERGIATTRQPPAAAMTSSTAVQIPIKKFFGKVELKKVQFANDGGGEKNSVGKFAPTPAPKKRPSARVKPGISGAQQDMGPSKTDADPFKI
ncbi:uncharacterized protein SPPG_05200 [Spizellomyces punctatus DAOM BR117]|uniref:SAM domain-containing protein n=1 Tax=Spizellomyces punctatus (strain DAOM BR117) TaxID=645134 RepID=A0A0L0HFM2_SPIPD|nr:uncharacterized protein SPPG_05200 [Spizellomyces punctatus DAOM BR117]KNC99826.1 hypothetical protein SPPG_05200 [Spizellomyces punctatus DAOM BR117]|eukprot:XP_016607866.1 hypothetical protein SPPG_05200 [Spizellomyces punctatus DAOM BR117]